MTIDFLKYRALYAVLSVGLFVSFAALYWQKSATRETAFVYSVEFTGGLEVLYASSQRLSSEKVEQILADSGISGVVCRAFSDSNDVIVRVPLRSLGTGIDKVPAQMLQVLQESLPGVSLEIQKTDVITAGVGEQMRWKSFQAVCVGLLLMLLYIACRFWSFAFAAGAVFALLHDTIVILMFFLLFDFEISLNVIGAILAVLGYSINDTIVIFSRIRENIIKLPGKSLYSVVNISLNETLRRTLLTSAATTLVVVPLAVYGGQVLQTLSLALLVGFVFGTYSSIYIASPVMMLLYQRRALIRAK